LCWNCQITCDDSLKTEGKETLTERRPIDV
jgi:hypothetical protein